MNRIRITTMLFFIFIFHLQAFDQVERTFAMIKPYAVKQGKTEEILTMIDQAGFTVLTIKQLQLTTEKAQELYEDRKDCRWFANYIRAMTLSPVVVMILEKVNAVDDWDICKKKIRAHYALICKKNNVVHGSDSQQAAQREIALFFDDAQY